MGLYQDNGNTDLAKTDGDIIDNIVEEVHAIEWISNSATYKMEKLNMGILREEQQQDTFCMKRAKIVRSKQVDGFVLDKNGILQKFVRLKYTVEPTIVVPRKLTSLIIIEFHISCTVNMIRHYFWWASMHRDICQHINSCQLFIQFLPNQLYTLPMHLEIQKVPFAGCAMDGIGPLPATSKGNRHTLMFICLLTLYLIMASLKSKTADGVSMVYNKEILPTTSCCRFIFQDNGMEFKNDQLMSVFNTLGIKCIYSNPYYAQGNGRIENVHNFLKCTIAKFIYGSSLEQDDALPLASYCYNVAPSVDDLESPYYLVHDHDPLKGRLSNIQNYCRYIGNQPGRLAVQELQKLWKLHAKLLTENRMAEPAANKKTTSASDLKIGQLVLVKKHCKGPFNPTYIYNN